MFNVNRVTLLGNATHDPEPRATKTGTAVTSLGLATDRRVKDEQGKFIEKADFHKLVCFGALAEFSAKSVMKGAPLYIEGRLQTNRFKNKEGKDVSTTEIVVDRLVLLSSKKGKMQAAGNAEVIAA